MHRTDHQAGSGLDVHACNRDCRREGPRINADGRFLCALVPFIYLPVILAADFFRARLVGSAKATATLKLVSAIMLAAVVAVLIGKIQA